MQESLFWQIGIAGLRDQLYPVVLRKVDIPLEFQVDYGVYALYTCLEIEQRKVSAELMSAALREWQERYPEGGNTSNRFWAQLMDKWVEERLPFLPEDKRRSVSLQLIREQFNSLDTTQTHENIWVVFGDDSRRKAGAFEVPARKPNFSTTFKARLSAGGEVVATEEGSTGNCIRQTWLLSVAERLPRRLIR